MQQYKSFFGEMHVKIADFAKKRGEKSKKSRKMQNLKMFLRVFGGKIGVCCCIS